MRNSALKKVSAFLLTAAMISTMAVGSFTGAYAQENEKAISNNLRLNVTFDDETAQDLSGNGFDGEIVGDVEFVEGQVGKAVHIVNDESVAAQGKTAQQYIDFGDSVKFGTDDFTVMFWYKSAGTDPYEVSVLSNKDWRTGDNDGIVFGDMKNGMLFNVAAGGSGRIETSRYPDATDGQWHHIAVTVDREGDEILYIDGEMVEHKDIFFVEGLSLDVEGNHLVLGADGCFNFGVKDSYIDELKIYRKVLDLAEIKTIVSPICVNAEENSAFLTWDESDFENRIEGAYVVVYDGAGNATRFNMNSGSSQVTVTGLEPDTFYRAILVTREKDNNQNYQDVYEFTFTTTDGDNTEYGIFDVNHDNVVDVNDATGIQIFLGKVPQMVFDQTLADVNADGKITIRDATEIQTILSSAYQKI